MKCPYSARNVYGTNGFSYNFDAGSGQLKHKESHQYFSQVQGQMAIGERPWCDFVIFTLKGISVQWIPSNRSFGLTSC